MPILTELVRTVPPNKVEEAEDVFAFAHGLIFTDDSVTNHGNADWTIIYKSVRFGDIELNTANPEGEDERKLFGHYLWNAGVKIAELISDEGDLQWSVQGEKVLELGAGVGLGGIVATLAGSNEVAISDYPAPVILANIRANAAKNIPSALKGRYRVDGHEWCNLRSNFAAVHKHYYSRILAADCYWMPHQHKNLACSMLWFLSEDPAARVFAVAGFHTGRANVAAFFATAEEQGLVVQERYEEDVQGNRREWLPERDGGFEDHTEKKRWLVIARLKRAS